MINTFQSCKKKNPDPPANKPPVADAKVSRPEAIVGDTITLKGSGTDADGTVTAYLWSQMSGPNSASILNAGSANSIVNGLVEGTYIFQLIVTDNAGATGVDTVSVKIIPPPCIEKGEWQGFYGTPGADILTAPDLSFINGGIAQLNNSPWPYFYSSNMLKIPECHFVNGDNIKLIVRLKNPSDEIGAVAPYDVSLWFVGSEDSAHVQFLNQYPELTALKVGGIGVTNTNDLIHLFQEWTELTLEAKSKKLTVYINGSIVKQIDYTGISIGVLKEIQISFKGPGLVDWVKLASADLNTRIFQEDFDVNGSSNVIWN